MTYQQPELPSLASRWTSRIAVFAIALAASAAVLHRAVSLSTPIALNLVALAFALATLSLALAGWAAIGIWRKGEPGTARVIGGALLSLSLLASPLLALPLVWRHPPINDLSTDVVAPPEFKTLAATRGSGANPSAYPGVRFAKMQEQAYPDLKPMLVNRTPDEAFELTVEALKRMHMDIVREEPPSPDTGAPGAIEAVDRTLIAGFYDDVAVRVGNTGGSGSGARIDIRSASRYGTYDLGRNADRMRNIMREVVARLEATVPSADEPPKPQAGKKPGKQLLKRDKSGDPKSAAPRSERDRARSDARRGPEQKAPQPQKAARPETGKRPGQGFE